MAQAYGAEALQCAVDIMRKETSTDQAKLAAANTILDRAYGKPPQSQDINFTGDLHIESMSDRQLFALLARIDAYESASLKGSPGPH